MRRRVGVLTESAAVGVAAIMAGIACCGPIVIQWLGLLVWAIGGRALLLGLVRFEIPILALVAAASFLGRRLARDRPTRWANTLLSGVAVVFVVLRLTWEIRRGVVMAVDPVLTAFSYRQTVLLTAAGLVFATRLALLISGLWQRARAASACRVEGTRHRRSRPTWN